MRSMAFENLLPKNSSNTHANSTRFWKRLLPGTRLIASAKKVADSEEAAQIPTNVKHGTTQPACWKTMGRASIPGPLILLIMRMTLPPNDIVFLPKNAPAAPSAGGQGVFISRNTQRTRQAMISFGNTGSR
jgi:hypothetical protein